MAMDNEQKSRLKQILWMIAGLGAIVALLILIFQPDPASFKSGILKILDYLETRPLLLWLGIAVLPGMGFPISPLLMLSGAVFGDAMGMASTLAVAISAVILNMAWTYWVAAYPARKIAVRLLRHFGYEIPELPKHHHLKFAFIVRVTPGPPFFVQNYLLGLSGISFRVYMIASTIVHSIYCSGFLILGDSFTSGSYKTALVGLAVLVLAGVGIAWLRKRAVNETDITD